MKCKECLDVLDAIGESFNTARRPSEFLEHPARAMVRRLGIKACQFLLLSRDRRRLEHVAAHGLSESFLARSAARPFAALADALQGRTVAISDCAADHRLEDPTGHSEEGLVAALIAPLRSREQVFGVVRLYTGEQHRFTEVELRIVEVLTSFCARAIVHSRFQQIQSELRRAVAPSLDLDHLLGSTARVVSEQLGAKGCSIHVVEGRRLGVRASHGLSRRFLEVVAESRQRGIRLAMAGSYSQIHDPSEKPRSPFLDEVRHEGVASILFVPLMSGSEAIGVLCVYMRHPYRFSADEIFFMRGIAGQCALAVLQTRIHSEVKRSYESLVDDFQLWFGTTAAAVPQREG